MTEEIVHHEIYVYLLDEGTDVWRPVDAILLQESIYQINPDSAIPETEIWQFLPGDIVRCEEKRFIKGRGLVAVEKLELPKPGYPNGKC
jgi:hypothetical protein